MRINRTQAEKAVTAAVTTALSTAAEEAPPDTAVTAKMTGSYTDMRFVIAETAPRLP